MSRTHAVRVVTHFDTADEIDMFLISRDAVGRIHIVDAAGNDRELSADEARAFALAILDAAGGSKS